MRMLAVVIVALTLGGCAGQSVLTGGTSITATIQNPVTPTMLYQAESGLIVAVAGLQTHKDLCIAKVIDRSCRAVVVKLQSYTIRLKPMLISLHAFVRNNDQINAIAVYNTVRQLLADFQQDAAASGVATGVK